MPIYEYKCENGHVFDVMQSMSDDPLTECTVCDVPVRKVLHPVSISFKGSGFYSTDYNNKKGPKGEPKEAAATRSNSSNGSSGSGSNTEKKPEKATKAESAKEGD